MANGLDAAAPYIAEFVGTFMLVFTIGCAVLTGSAWAATAIACVLMVMIYALGPVSGGNFNPAVSLSLCIAGKLEPTVMLGYWVVQLLAGISAGFAYSLMLGKNLPLSPTNGFDLFFAGGVETLYTFMLCFVVLNVACAKKQQPNQFFALAIGFVIIAGGCAVGGISGACFNPAVAIGLDVSSYADGMGDGFIYTVFELVGAAIAALLFRVVRPEEYNASLEGTPPGMVAKCVSEFIGTYMLVVTVGFNIIMGSTSTAWSAAACLMCMIYSLGDISGGNFNPAVSSGILISGRGKLPPTDWIVYVLVQTLAGAAAGFTYGVYNMEGKRVPLAIAPGITHHTHWTLSTSCMAETMFTFVLVFVVLCVAIVKDQNTSWSFALAIGSCVTAGGFAIGGISGGALNPAVALGITCASVPSGTFTISGLHYFGIWMVMELLGGVLAAGIFRLTYPNEYKPSAYHSLDQDRSKA